MTRIGVQQAANHPLVLRAMLCSLALEKFNAALRQRNGHLYAFLPSCSGEGKKSGMTFRSPIGSLVYLIFSVIDSFTLAPGFHRGLARPLTSIG